jgi:hypothetical protein
MQWRMIQLVSGGARLPDPATTRCDSGTRDTTVIGQPACRPPEVVS